MEYIYKTVQDVRSGSVNYKIIHLQKTKQKKKKKEKTENQINRV